MSEKPLVIRAVVKGIRIGREDQFDVESPSVFCMDLSGPSFDGKGSPHNWTVLVDREVAEATRIGQEWILEMRRA